MSGKTVGAAPGGFHPRLARVAGEGQYGADSAPGASANSRNELYYCRPAGDPDILIDADFTRGETAITGDGWTLSGSGGVWDENGFNGKGTEDLRLVQSLTADFNTAGTIIMEFERTALMVDEADFPSVFYQSEGNNVTSGNEYALVVTRPSGADELRAFKQSNGTYNLFFEGTSSINHAYTHNQNTLKGGKNARFATLVCSWNASELIILLDGSLIGYNTTAGNWTETGNIDIRVCAQAPGANRLGDFYVKRLQLLDGKIPTPSMSTNTFTIFGDSFMKRGLNNSTAEHLSLANWNSSANLRFVYNSWANVLAHYSLDRPGGVVPSINSVNLTTENGQGWGSGGQFSSGAQNAVIADDPDYVITASSVNDVGGSVTSLITEYKTILDNLIDNASNIKQIFIFNGFAGFKDAGTDNLGAYQVMIDAVKQLNGYRDKVTVFNIFREWGGHDYDQDLTIGSATGNVTATADSDVHPSPMGEQYMGKIIFQRLQGLLN